MTELTFANSSSTISKLGGVADRFDLSSKCGLHCDPTSLTILSSTTLGALAGLEFLKFRSYEKHI